jgi:hypothetical protein
MAAAVAVEVRAVRAAVAAAVQVVPAVAVAAALAGAPDSVAAAVDSMRSVAMPICPEERWPREARGGC